MGFVRLTNTLLAKTFALLLAVAIATANFGVKLPITPRGIQCPTATVQQVVEVVREKNCCGELVAKTVVRKPREGEAEFKQCRCAESKAANHEQDKDSTTGSVKPIMVAFVQSDSQEIDWGHKLCLTVEVAHRPLSKLPLIFEPPTPPPQFI